MKIKTSKVIILWLLVVILSIAVPLSYLLFNKSLYFSDRIIVLFNDENNANHALIVELVSYEMAPYYYHHTYFAILLDEKKNSHTKSHEFNSFNGDFQAKDFIKNIKKENNENILDEDYLISLQINNKNIEIDLTDLRGDFLINNSLDRFTYMNLGNTEIKINGQGQQADFAMNRTSSINHGKLMLSQNVRAKGQAVFLADKDGALYYTDITNVPENSTNYMSHAWSINKHDNVLRKDVSERINITDIDQESYILDLPHFDNAYIKINKTFIYPGIIDYALLRGELIDNHGEKIIRGFSMQYDYR
ncbi:hypothetical protein HON36_00980 [Candidatus Parcubacteria bacterium]|jgi:hypothetical protein|nr:hypothetical protein [Candidatus Parcubacteria bacterium]